MSETYENNEELASAMNAVLEAISTMSTFVTEDDLDELTAAIDRRRMMERLGKLHRVRVGMTVRLNENVRPAYLNGQECEVKRVGPDYIHVSAINSKGEFQTEMLSVLQFDLIG